MKIDAILKNSLFDKGDKKVIKNILEELAEEKRAIHLPGGKWVSPNVVEKLTGTIQFTHGCIKFMPENGDGEIALTQAQAGNAWDQDIVTVGLLPGSQPPVAVVTEILQRTQPEVATRYARKDGRNIICRSVGRRAPIFFSIPAEKGKKDLPRLKPGQLVLVRPLKPLPNGDWQAEFVKAFDKENALAIQEELVKLNHSVPEKFPALALSQAENLPATPSEADFQGRADMRDLDFVTIDGADARDFDDAIYVEKTEDGWLLRVAIADVSHYVRPDANPDSLDGEARTRGNSWYFPRSVEPMLPKTLSNGLCSLNPEVDRLAMVAEIPFSRDGKRGNPKFAPAVIRSKARLTYDQAHSFFAGNKESLPEKVAPMLEEALRLYKVLAKKRREEGSLDFDLPEAAYEFNENGELQAIKHADRNEAHLLIEEFMIAANEAIAAFLEARKMDFPFRVHPVPEGMKLSGLYETLQAIAPGILPHDLNVEDLADPRQVQKILNKAKGTPYEYVVNRLCLRSMSQARYQTDNVGHFALAAPSYCHFTSPIRRYADLLVHRALKAALGLEDKKTVPAREELEQIDERLNKLERKAIDCEREMAKRLSCLFLGTRKGQTYTGSISGVTDFGLFVELNEIPAEGIIKIRELGNDWFDLDQARQMLIGRKTGRTYQLGQPIKVRVLEIDEDRMETRLGLADGAPGMDAGHKGGRKGKSFENERRKESQKKKKGREKPHQIGAPSRKSHLKSSKTSEIQS